MAIGIDSLSLGCYNALAPAGVAQLVERQLPKLNVASSSLVSRSKYFGDVAEWLGNGLQNRPQQFDSARRLQSFGRVAQLVRALR